MVDSSLAASTIDLNINIIKQIRKSLRDKDGNKLPPYQWDAEVIDAPILDKKLQKRPIPSAQAVQDAIKCGTPTQNALWALLAGSGLRIEEALALHVGPTPGKSYWDHKESKLIILRQDTKTDAGVREVDLASVLNEFLKITIPWNTGEMFRQSESAYRLALIKCGIIGGFHSLRRFRITHIRTEGVPDPMVHFWVGHEDETVTDGYTIVKSEIVKRKTLVEKVGLGFQLPEIK
jgi:integrase